MSSTSWACASPSPASARSGSSSADGTGRGASGQTTAACRPDIADLAESAARLRSGTTVPRTTGPAANSPSMAFAAGNGSSAPPMMTTSREPWTPARTSLSLRLAARWTPSMMVWASRPRGVPTRTDTDGWLRQPSAATREASDWSCSPRSSASTTSASSRASQAPRASAVWA